LSITTIHYRFAVGAFLIYDITNEASFKNCKEWLQKIREYSDENVVVALVGNKKDLVEDRDLKIDYNTEEFFTGFIESETEKGKRFKEKNKVFKDVI
jgi:GTPase SAR1 family protein